MKPFEVCWFVLGSGVDYYCIIYYKKGYATISSLYANTALLPKGCVDIRVNGTIIILLEDLSGNVTERVLTLSRARCI